MDILCLFGCVYSVSYIVDSVFTDMVQGYIPNCSHRSLVPQSAGSRRVWLLSDGGRLYVLVFTYLDTGPHLYQRDIMAALWSTVEFSGSSHGRLEIRTGGKRFDGNSEFHQTKTLGLWLV